MKILSTIVILVLVLGLGILAPVAAAGEVSVSLNAPDEVVPDSDFTATIDIGEVVDSNAVQYDISFDPSVLRLDDITPGLIDSTETPVLFNEIGVGTYRVVQSMGLATVNGSGYLSVLHFHVIGSLGQSSDIKLSNGILSGMEAEISATWIGDSVSIISAESDGKEPPPTALPPSESGPATAINDGKSIDNSGLGSSSEEKGTAATPTAKPVNWPVLWGVIGGVVIILGLIIFLQVRRRLY